MAKHFTSKAIPAKARIDNRMANSKKKRLDPTNWEIKGELFLNCSCTVFCPCVVSLGEYPPTEGYCHAWMAIAIDEGHYEGESLTAEDLQNPVIGAFTRPFIHIGRNFPVTLTHTPGDINQ